MPELAGGDYLLDAMQRLGPIRATEAGPRAADWPEIHAFAAATGAITEPWEAQAMRDMCRAYLDGLTTGAEPLSIAPVERAT